jgi:heme exporter protein D
MSSVATGSRARRVDARAKSKGQRRLAGGVVWIVVVATLLAGVVAINVAVLRTNLSLDTVNRQRGQLQADIAAQQAKLASAKRTGDIVNGVPGLVQADPTTTLTVDLRP